VQQTLRGPDIAFVLVTSPSPPAIKEVLYFIERLEEAKMPRGALVVNRFHLPPPPAEGVTEADVSAEIAARRLQLEEDAPSRMLRAHADASRLASLDAAHVKALQATSAGTPTVRVAELDTDVQDLALLAQLSDILMAGGV
jgi:hypothetical protein